MERVAMIAGTLQPKPRMSGTKDFPCSPNLRISPSMTNAARAMYPLSSSSESARNMNKMFGKNTITPPTPPIRPSVSRSRRYGSVSSPQCDFTKSESQPKESSIQPMKGSAQVNVNQNVAYIIAKKIGRPKNLFVITESITSEISRRFSPEVEIASRHAPESIA